MSEDDDDDYHDENCPICFEKFKFPKLLPCRHTFCKTCLNVYSEQKQAAEKEKHFSCPVCRTNCKVPKGGVQNIPTNFFVDDKILSVGHQCSRCSDRLPAEDAQCRRCVLEKIKADESSQTEDENEDSDHFRDIPSSFILGSPTVRQIRTIFRAKLLSSIILENYSTLEIGITALGPTDDNNCWVVLGRFPELFKINSSGKKLEHLFVWPPMTIFDVACKRDGSVMILSHHHPNNAYGIWQMDEKTDNIGTFFIFKNFRGHDIELFPDERIVVAGTTATRTKSEPVEIYGMIHIISKEGNLISTFKSSNNNINLRGLAINPITGLLCLTTTRGVGVLTERGTFIERGKCTFLTRNSIFSPTGICCDKSGYIIVCDEVSGVLHVMSSVSNFCGIVTTATTDNVASPFGNPFLVAYSSSGDLWVGDKEIGEVRLYSITNYVNKLHYSSF